MITSMTSDQAVWEASTASLEAALTRASCKTIGPDLFWRGDDEAWPEWAARREEAKATCTRCPVLSACKELALRTREGEHAGESMIRAGYTGKQLATLRREQAERLEPVTSSHRSLRVRRSKRTGSGAAA